MSFANIMCTPSGTLQTIMDDRSIEQQLQQQEQQPSVASKPTTETPQASQPTQQTLAFQPTPTQQPQAAKPVEHY